MQDLKKPAGLMVALLVVQAAAATYHSCPTLSGSCRDEQKHIEGRDVAGSTSAPLSETTMGAVYTSSGPFRS